MNHRKFWPAAGVVALWLGIQIFAIAHRCYPPAVPMKQKIVLTKEEIANLIVYDSRYIASEFPDEQLVATWEKQDDEEVLIVRLKDSEQKPK